MNTLIVTLLKTLWTLAALVIKLPFVTVGLLVRVLYSNAYFVYAVVIAGLAYNIVHAGGLL